MKIAFISTINSQKQISKLGDIDFCLAPFCLIDKYRKYFDKSDRYVILDDSVAENGGITPFKDLVDLAIEMEVNEVIIPDMIGDFQKSKLMREEFLDEFSDILHENNIKIQSVIQGNTWNEYINSYTDIDEDDRIDVIGVPFRMNYTQFNDSTKEESHMWNRLLFLEWISPTKPIHMLGCNLATELIFANNDNIRSCDSKLMARYGFNNQYWDFDDRQKPSKKLYINSEMTLRQIKIAKENIKMLRKEIEGGE